MAQSVMRAFVNDEIAGLQSALTSLAQSPYPDLLSSVAQRVAACLGAGGKVLFCGNGGSAADAQHLAAELVGRQNYDRPPAAGMALTVDTSALTAISNDYGYENVFSRQVQALGNPGDVLFGISTSGRSVSVVRALESGHAGGLSTVSFTGAEPNDMADSDFVVAVPANRTAKIQELQMVCGHIVFALVELSLYPEP